MFVNVVGFSAVERHALNTLFRLSEGRGAGLPAYGLWAAGAPAPVKMALLDGTSEAAGNGTGIATLRMGDTEGMFGTAHQSVFLNRRETS